MSDTLVPRSRWRQALLLAACGLAACGGTAAQTPRDADGIARFEFSVRAVNPAELPVDNSGRWTEQYFDDGVAAGALGLVAAPMFASALIVGGLILGPGALILSSSEHHIWQRAADALKDVDFERDLLHAVQAHAARTLPVQPLSSGPGATADVELVVNAFGLAGSMYEVCFIASVDLIVQAAGKETLRDRLTIARGGGSADAPLPQCSSLERMGEREGQLIRDTAAEYAEVLAIMAVDRIAAKIK